MTDENKRTAGCLGLSLGKKAGEGSIQFLRILVRQVSAALSNSRLHAHVNRQNERLTQAICRPSRPAVCGGIKG